MTDSGSMTNPSEAMVEAGRRAAWEMGVVIADVEMESIYTAMQQAATPAAPRKGLKIIPADPVVFEDATPAASVQDDDALTPEDAWQDLVDKSDRTSPEEYPDHALITFEELQDYMKAARLTPAPVQDDDAEFLLDLALTMNDIEAAAVRRIAARLTPDRVTPLVEALRYTMTLLQSENMSAESKMVLIATNLTIALRDGGFDA